WKVFLAALGPGILVMLADTDAGSIVTAAQSGARWGYHLLLMQALLVPALYIVQELTVRLGIFTGKGHAELIRERFGPGYAWIAAAALWVTAFGALLTEFSGIEGAGELFGIPAPVSLSASALFVLAIVLSGRHRLFERVAIALGSLEIAFFIVAYKAHPHAAALATGLLHVPLGNPDYRFLVAANIGAVIMPWMIFYQQSAIADRRLRAKHYLAARWDTALGALVTQAIMCAVLIATAATLGADRSDASLSGVGDVSRVLAPVLGAELGRIVFALGMVGAALVAAIVVSLAAAWGFGEVTGRHHSLAHHPIEAPQFCAFFTAAILGAVAVVGFAPDAIELNIGVEVLNAVLLPVPLGFLVLLAFRALPSPHRPRGLYACTVVTVAVLTAGLGLYAGISGAHLLQR
ncbi:MAG: NRAMP family divalent metal transporter, partial [Steroidobacteraceae bacterium]